MPDTSRDTGPGELTEEHKGRINRRDTDQDRTLTAMQQLEAALATAAPRREQAGTTRSAGRLPCSAKRPGTRPTTGPARQPPLRHRPLAGATPAASPDSRLA